MTEHRRGILIVLDGVGAGALPDAAEYGDVGADTLAHVVSAAGGLRLPNLSALGLGYLGEYPGIGRPEQLLGDYGRMNEASVGKDTTTGHWEMMGLVVEQAFPTYPEGFPPEVIQAFSAACGREVIGNLPASGTEIIQQLGEEHLRTGKLIVYTSADSVFQIAAHEDVVPLEELYRICQTARDLLVPPHQVLRVIARPFSGRPGNFFRTAGRRDFSLPPPGKTLLDRLQAERLPTVGIGKIGDIFCGRGLSQTLPTKDNRAGMEETLNSLRRLKCGLVFTNLVDFDTRYGHRNDYLGFAQALQEFDAWLPELLAVLTPQDLLIIASDHGCDPLHPGTDHTREYGLLLVHQPGATCGRPLGIRHSFADIAASLADFFGLEAPKTGESFLFSGANGEHRVSK